MPKLPLSYSMRNLRRRPWQTIMTIAGISVVIFAAVLMLSLCAGLATRLDVTGEDDNILVISRKGTNAMFSSIDVDEMVNLMQLPGVATDANGRAMVSPELMHISFVGAGVEGGRVRAPVQVRGVNPIAFDVHRIVKVRPGGRLPENSFEILAGRSAHVKLSAPPETLAVGRKVTFESKDWTIVGIFDADGALFESELWVRESDLHTVMRRRTHSFAVIKMRGPAEVAEAVPLFSQSGPYEKFFKGWAEKDYYREATEGIYWVYWLSMFMVGAVTVAGALIGINTMYTIIINRMSEIATQRVLGFGRLDILMGLMVESIVLSLAGGVLGVGFGLLANGIPMKMSVGAFYLLVDYRVITAALGLSVLIGIVGALLPAYKGLRLSIVQAMRYN